MTNSWLQMFKKRVDNIIYLCEECRLRSAIVRGMNFGDVVLMLKGSCQEIERLQKEIDRLQGEVTALKPKEAKEEKSEL